MRKRNGAAQILLVEDNPGDRHLIGKALAEASPSATMNVVDNTADALGFLHQEGKFAGAPRPDIVLLDLRLRGHDGKEVLREIKKDPNLRRIPVIVFSSSYADYDVMTCYDLQANCYVVKPFDLEPFTAAVKSIADFWLDVATLPPK